MTEPARIVLDFDGTIVSCRNRQMAVLRAVIPARMPCDYAQIWQLKRSGHSTSAALVAAGIAPQIADRAARDWLAQIELPCWLSLDRCFDGARAALERAARHAQLHLLTARMRPHWLRCQIRNLGLEPFFAQITIVDPDGAARHKSEALRTLRPSVFIGDSESDADAARTAGVTFVAVAGGQRSRQFLTAAGVTRCADDLAGALAL